MDTIELYFTATCKDGQVLEVVAGPFPSSYDARMTIPEGCRNERCRQEVVRSVLPCEIV